jgi:hypothetical protein
MTCVLHIDKIGRLKPIKGSEYGLEEAWSRYTEGVLVKIHVIMTSTILAISGCAADEEAAKRTGSGDGSGMEQAEETDAVECPDQWEQEGDLWIDPILCAAWSPASSDRFTWHEAVSTQEAAEGGCNQFCDADLSTDYCAQLTLGGIDTWRVPNIDELGDLSRRVVPFADPVGFLWTIDSDSMDQLAWTADLSEAGMEALQDKSNPIEVRCLAY